MHIPTPTKNVLQPKSQSCGGSSKLTVPLLSTFLNYFAIVLLILWSEMTKGCFLYIFLHKILILITKIVERKFLRPAAALVFNL